MSLIVVCALAFIAIFVVLVVALLSPLVNAEKAAKAARLAEVNRYRVVGAIGVTPEQPAEEKQQSPLAERILTVIDRLVEARGYRTGLLAELERSGMRIRPEEWAAVKISATITGAVVCWLVFGNGGWLLIGGVIGWLAVRLFTRRRIAKRTAAFEEQLPNALELLSGALRAGFALNQAVYSVVREGVEPVAGELSRALAEVRLGATLEDALDHVADRMGSADMAMVVMAVRTAREVGGNLAEVLEQTVTTMRDRVDLRGQVRVLSAEGRLSAKVLVGLPIMLALYLYTVRPGYLDVFVTTFGGIVAAIVAVVLLVGGSLWLKKLVKIEV